MARPVPRIFALGFIPWSPVGDLRQRHIRNSAHGSKVTLQVMGGGTVARQPKEPSYTETIVVFVIVIVIVVVIVTPLWDCSYPIATSARKRGGIQSEGQDAG